MGSSSQEKLLPEPTPRSFPAQKEEKAKTDEPEKLLVKDHNLIDYYGFLVYKNNSIFLKFILNFS